MVILINGKPLSKYILENRDSWNKTRISLSEIKQVAELKKQGMENRIIADMLNLNEEQVKYRLSKAKEMGLNGKEN